MRPARVVTLAVFLGFLAVTCACVGRSGSTAATVDSSGANTVTTTVAPTLTSSTAQVARPDGSMLNTVEWHPTSGGPFPVVVFLHGANSSPLAYEPFLEKVARRGYVVVAPTFASNDLLGRAHDVRLLLDALTSSVDDPLGLPPSMTDTQRIALVGHSLGGADVLHVAFHPCCKDQRITAAVTFEAPVGGIDGPFDWHGPPLLAVLGDQDPLVPNDVGPLLVRSLETPGFVLTVHGGGHGGGLHADDVGAPTVQDAFFTFLAAELSADSDAAVRLRDWPDTDTVTIQAVHT